jgi:hypothetical protein
LLEIEWNRIEGVLFDIFYQLCGARFDKAHAIFFSVQAHRGRREMVEEVALYALADKPQIREQLNSLMRRLRNVMRSFTRYGNGMAGSLGVICHPIPL